MDVLETTEANRRVDSLAIDHDLLRQKDSEIARLNQELAALRSGSEGAADGTGGDERTKQDAVKSMIYSVKKNRQQRKSHVSELQTMTAQLEESIASDDKQQMLQLIESLKSAIQAGEKSNSKMDREMVNMIDFSSAHFLHAHVTPGADANLDELVAENQKLRRKLEKKNHCKKCGHKRSEKKEEKSLASTLEDDKA